MSALDGAVTIIQNKLSPNPVMKAEGVESYPMLESFFRLDKTTQKQREQLQEVQDYLSRQGDDEMSQLTVLKDIRYRLAQGDLFSVHKWIKLRNLSTQYKTQAEALENA